MISLAVTRAIFLADLSMKRQDDMQKQKNKNKNSDWSPIGTLREVGQDYSGRSIGNRSSSDFLEIREIDGMIHYRHKEKYWSPHEREFDTQYGLFVSDDQGEFGGKLILPDGSEINGNYCDVFDLGDKVIAVGSFGHLLIGRFQLLEFSGIKDYRTLYSTYSCYEDLGILSGEKEENISEDLTLLACTKSDRDAWFLIGGSITYLYKKKKNEYFHESRLLYLENGTVTEKMILKNVFSYCTGMVKKSDLLYVGMDKMVARLDPTRNSVRYWTSISEGEQAALDEKYGPKH